MRHTWIGCLVVLVWTVGCSEVSRTPADERAAETATSLLEARRGFSTKIVRREPPGEPLPEPPAQQFRRVSYPSAVGKLGAYLSTTPDNSRRRPAIIWITGGDYNTLDDGIWQPQPAENDQSASAFREQGIVTMFPTFRGGNDNPGDREGFFGEVDDVLAAADFLAAQHNVDPARIYLGGHSTGATLVLLVAASTDRFRAVFAFGPADDIRGYGEEMLPFDLSNPRELELRQPNQWIAAVRCPLYVIEGTDLPGNIDALDMLAVGNQNPLVRFQPVPGQDHFSVLRPATRAIANRILSDTGPAFGEFGASELAGP